jgi:sulfate transport system permease protein
VVSAAERLPTARRGPLLRSGPLAGGVVVGYLSLIVLVPLAALAARAGDFGRVLSNPEGMSALKLTLALSLAVALVNAVIGTATAWVLVRDDFHGKWLVNGVIDLPFALPTIVAGLTLLALYGPRGSSGINLAYTRAGVLLALLFVTLPFVVRTVQPVLRDFDAEVEEAAASLGASRLQTFRRVMLPELLPAVATGFILAFARALGEYGSVIFIAGNMPLKSEITPLLIMIKLEQFDYAGATAIALVFLLMSFALLFLINFVSWRRNRRLAVAEGGA